MSLFSIKNKVIIVTGGAGILGRQYVETLKQAGAQVVVWDKTGMDDPVDITSEISVKSAVEKIINQAEKELPPIKSFFVAGGTMLGASLDQARTVARRAERAVVRACLPTGTAADNNLKLGPATLPYLNRLSSLLYALARLANHRAGVKEEAPTYR